MGFWYNKPRNDVWWESNGWHGSSKPKNDEIFGIDTDVFDKVVMPSIMKNTEYSYNSTLVIVQGNFDEYLKKTLNEVDVSNIHKFDMQPQCVANLQTRDGKHYMFISSDFLNENSGCIRGRRFISLEYVPY